MSEKFLDLGVAASYATALETLGIVEPTPIQARAIPAALAGSSVVGQSATGTGKTLAYLLPVLQEIDPAKPAAQAIVLAPTFELGMQIFRQAELLVRTAGSPIVCASLIGGANIARQVEKLKKKPQLIVGSAERIMELNRKGKLRLEQARTLVLDEADKLLDDQNQAGVRRVAEAAAPGGCRYLLFSATISPRTLRRADFVREPQIVSLKDEIILQPDIENIYFVAEFRDKIEVLRKLAALLRVRRGLVFVNRSGTVETAVERLRFHGVAAAALNAAAGKLERKKALDDFSRGRTQLLVATEVAARGLDIADVDFVFNLDLPEDEKAYLHRAGRTGRAGKSGCAVTLADPKEVAKLTAFAAKLKLAFQPKRMFRGAVEDANRAPRRRKAAAPAKSAPVKVKSQRTAHTK